MEFELLGRKIEISEGRKNYMNIRTRFVEMADTAAKAFRSDYEDTFSLTFFSSSYAEKLNNKYTDSYFKDFVMQYVQQTRRLLTTYGIYTISDQDIYDAITEEHDGITRLQETFEEYIVNLVANAPDDATDRDFAPKIRDKFDRGYFSSALRNDILAMCDYVLEYLHSNQAAEIQFVYKDDAQKARAYYQNLKDSLITDEQYVEAMASVPRQLSADAFAAEVAKRLPPQIPHEEKVKLCYDLIALDPRDEDYYRYIFEKLPEAKYEIAAIAKYLSVDISDLVEEDLNQNFDIKTIHTEQAALQMMEDLQTAMKHYGLQEFPVKTELKKIIHNYDVEARTYFGILFETRELRAKAEADYQAIEALYSNKADLGKQECIEIITAIGANPCVEEIKNHHIRILQGKIGDIEKSEMQEIVKDLSTATQTECAALIQKIEAYDASYASKTTFITNIENRIKNIWRGELDAVVQDLAMMTEDQCNQAKQQIMAHNASENIKKPYFENIDKRIYAIWDKEDFARFTEMFKQTPVGDSAAVGQCCATIQKEGRTQCKEQFVQALYLLNENEVAAAAKYMLAKESGMLASLFNMGKKEPYQILTLEGKVIHPAIEESMRAQKEAKGSGLLGGLGKLKNSFGFGKAAAPSGAAKFCSNCGNPVTQGAKFCPSCGNKM